MNSLSKYPEIAEAFRNVANAKGYIVSPEEKHTINKIRNRSGRQLVLVYPSAAASGSQDNLKESEQTIVFLVEKIDPGIKPADEISKYAEIQQSILAIVDFIAERKETDCETFQNFTESGYNIDPVYNMFGGWSGWSLDLIF